MTGYREIVEPEPEPVDEIDRQINLAGRKGRATIIRAPKCKRLHCGYVWIFLGTLAAGGMALTGASLFVIAVMR